MRTVIGEYHSFGEAQRAVRGLERHVSIQDIVITGAGGLKLQALLTVGGRAQRAVGGERFVVLMSGERAAVERARALLVDASAAPS